MLVPYVLPDELVRIEPLDARKGVARARLRSVIEPSIHRAPAPCPVYTHCGGCHYQHANYANQLELKTAALREVLTRIGKIEPPAEIAAIGGPEWEYRNRIQLHFREGEMGFHAANSHNIIPIERCPISSPALNAAIGHLNKLSRERRWPNFLRSLELFTNETQFQVNVLDSGDRHLARAFFDWLNNFLPGATNPSLEYNGFRVSHKSFFQVNRFLLDKLVEATLPTAPVETAWDLYAGVGLFSRALANVKVTAVEASASAIADLQQNAPRATAVKASVELWLEEQTATPGYVLADPPRAGLGKQAVKQLTRLQPPQLTIVSCDPSTLARDLSALLAAGYRIESMSLIDLFPQTSHIETITRLRL